MFLGMEERFDVIHKKSAKYFFQASQKAEKSRKRSVGGGERASIAVKTAVNDVMLSAEFCNARRRIAHLLGMYGFVIFLVTTVILIFSYPTSATAPRFGNRPLAYRRPDGLRRRILVLVLHPGRRCRRERLVSDHAGRSFCCRPACDHHLCADLVIPSYAGRCLDNGHSLFFVLSSTTLFAPSCGQSSPTCSSAGSRVSKAYTGSRRFAR